MAIKIDFVCLTSDSLTTNILMKRVCSKMFSDKDNCINKDNVGMVFALIIKIKMKYVVVA